MPQPPHQPSALRLRVGAIAAIVIICLTATVPPLSLAWVNDLREQTFRVAARLDNLRRVQELLIDAETGQRGYAITGNESFLQPFHTAVAALPQQFARLQSLHENAEPHESRLVQTLLGHAEQRLSGLQSNVKLRRTQGFAAVQAVISSGEGMQHAEFVRQAVVELTAIDSLHQARLDAALRTKITNAIVFAVGSTVATLLLLGYLAWQMQRALRGREHAALQLHTNGSALEKGMATLKQRNDEISDLGEMSRVLQTEMPLAEVLEIAGAFCAQLLPGTTGAIYMFRHSADMLELSTHWGGAAPDVVVVEPTSCWGLRRGHPHRQGKHRALRCRHLNHTEPGDFTDVCLPMIAQGDMLGLMHLRMPGSAPAEELMAMAQTVSEQVALSLSNTKLRQVLRDQSIRDALTGLFNRRFMEETLAKEMARAQRTAQPLSLIVLDLDHFKVVNDTHGHPAGDAVLRSAARRIAQFVRASDIACRYGGEEFVLILPDCNKAHAAEKARQMRDALRALTIVEGGHNIKVTASFGVATSGGHADGDDASMLFDAADKAVYAAKRSGRDRVVVSGQDDGEPAARQLALGAEGGATASAVPGAVDSATESTALMAD